MNKLGYVCRRPDMPLEHAVELFIVSTDGEENTPIGTMKRSDYTTENKQEDEAEWLYKMAVDNGIDCMIESDEFVVDYLEDNGIATLVKRKKEV